MALADNTIRNAKAPERPVKLYDAGGLFLLVTPNGGKWWRLKYRFEGKEKRLAFGVLSRLKEAREKRDQARKLLAQGIDPSAERKATKTAASESFAAIYREWLEKFSPRWAESHKENIMRRIEKDMLPWIGARPIAELKAADLRGALPPASKGFLAAITEPKAIGELLRSIDGYGGSFTVRCALRLAPLVFVRPGGLRGGRSGRSSTLSGRNGGFRR
jgi:hypothetical protein